MAIAPFARRRLIAPGSNDPRIHATQVILHVAVSEGASLFDFFARRSGGIESHFYITRNGVIEQYRDTSFEADANYTANCRAISIETQGMGSGEWTPAQLDAIKRLLMWAHDTHGIPLKVCPRHDAPGIGFHTLWGSPSPWTPVAKSCPGPDRIKQFHRDIVPWMNRGATTTEPTETDDMNLDEPLNIHDPRGLIATRNVTVREVLTAYWLELTIGKRHAKRYAKQAMKSKAGD